MKKWLFFLACLGAVAALSSENHAARDVSTLEPVQTVYLASQGERIVLSTDTGARGNGESLDAALRSLRDTSAAFVFLDTAEYLLVDPNLQHLIPTLQDLLRPSCRICLTEGQPDMNKIGPYLAVHHPSVALKDYLAGDHDLPILKTAGEGMQLVP